MHWIMRAISENSFDRRIVPHLKHLQYDRLRIKSTNVFSVSSFEVHRSLLCEREGKRKRASRRRIDEESDLERKRKVMYDNM